MASQQDEPGWRTVIKKLDTVAGEFLHSATLGLYEPEESEERSHVHMEPGYRGALERLSAGTAVESLGASQFGSGGLVGKLQKQLRKAEEKAFVQSIEYARINYLLQAAQREVSQIGLNSILQ